MRKFFSLLLFLCLNKISFSQEFEKEIKNLLQEKPKLEFKLDSRNSFISSSNVRVFGLKVGLIHLNKLSYGIGYNFLQSNIKVLNYKSELGLVDVNLFYRYWSPYIDYVFYEDSKWQLSIPIQLGFGTTFYRSKTNDNRKLAQEFVMSYEPAITFQYRVLEYFSLGAGIGYRVMLVDNKNIEERFNSPVYLLKFKFYFQDFYKDVINL